MMNSERLVLAFAASWSDDRTKTWSGTPYGLESALQQRTDIDCIDTPVVVNKLMMASARIAYVRRIEQRWMSRYRISHPIVWSEGRALRQAFMDTRADIALVIGDLGVPRLPFFTYFDHTYIHLDDDIKHGRLLTQRFRVFPPRMVKRRAKQQAANLRHASALVSMSEWDANALRYSGMVDPDRVFVVPPGRNAFGNRSAFTENRECRLLFVGTDFETKAGEQVVRAFVRLRSSVDYNVTLVIAGPKQWPLDGPIPEGVEFLGFVDYARVHAEMQRACAFVMPSLWEAYGIAFLEALGEGIPVIGRNKCAMPEFIVHGENGLLLEANDFGDEVLAEYMHTLCTDSDFRKRVHDQSNAVEYKFSWHRAADDMVRIAHWCMERGRPTG